MFRKESLAVAARSVLWPLVALAAWTSPSHAAITYNYTDQWIFDSTSGLYWQQQAIPTSTYVPDFGFIATQEQLYSLLRHVGLPSDFTSYNEAPYSLPLANLLSFFEFGTPADPVPTAVPGEYYLSAGAIIESGVTGHPAPNNHESASLGYGLNAASTAWSFYYTTTVFGYGPSAPCDAVVVGGTCPATRPALIVSSVNPSTIPLPATLWLLVAGIGGIGVLMRRTRQGLSVQKQ
jgi:hypothetical protein